MNGALCRAALAAVTTAAALCASTSHAVEAPATEPFDLGRISCWEMTGLDDTDRVSALVMVYGYVAGANDQAVQDAATIASTLERAGALCEANPDMYLARAIERARD